MPRICQTVLGRLVFHKKRQPVLRETCPWWQIRPVACVGISMPRMGVLAGPFQHSACVQCMGTSRHHPVCLCHDPRLPYPLMNQKKVRSL